MASSAFDTSDLQTLDGGQDAFGLEEFVSFSDDLLNSRSDPGFSDAYDQQLDLFGQNGMDEVSVASPTTFADENQFEQKHDLLEHSGEGHVPVAESATSTFRFEAALNVAFNVAEAERPKQVWETGIWKHIFGSDDSVLDFDIWGPRINRPTPALWGLDSQALETETETLKKRSHAQSCNFMDVVSFKPDVPWKDQREADLQRGIKLWIAVTSRWSNWSSLSVKRSEMRDEGEVFMMFAHVFAGRAPVTVRKRGAAILKICDYLEENNLEQFPMKELTFYRFLCFEESVGAPASRLKGMMQAIAFCRHVLDVPELQCILDSKRCSGVTREACPKERKQASPLTVNELNMLHSLVETGTDRWDAAFAGAALLCCYCRGRWGDLMRSEKAFVDMDSEGNPAFMETRTGRHKTMSSQMHRHQFLPMVAPVKGVNGSDWVTPWMAWRRELGLELPPHGLIMPAPDREGGATQRPLESGECGKWLRRLLGVDGEAPADPERRLSSHSLKCTMLSFAAKRGLSVPDRLMLGYHSSQMHMAMVYSRDGAASSLLLLEHLIDEIFRGKFKPDSTRSGRIIESPIAAHGPQQEIVKVEVVESSEEECCEQQPDSDSSGSTSDSGTTTDDIPADHSLNKVFAPPKPPEGFQSWQHSKLKTIHLTEPGYVRVFVCGRPVGSFHHKIVQNPRFDSPICWACFNKAGREDDSRPAGNGGGYGRGR